MTDEARQSGAAPLLLGMLLLATAGFVDAVGLLGFGLFPSFLSGDTTQFAVAAAQGRGAQAGLLAAVVVVFVAGAFLGRLLRLRTGRRSPTLVLEAAVLAVAAAAAHAGFGAAALAGAILAMGAQTTVLTHAGPLAVGATYVTGTLARLGSGLADALAGADRWGWIAYLLLWAALAAGAAGGALCYGRFGLESLLFAAAACAALAAAAGLVERRPARA